VKLVIVSGSTRHRSTSNKIAESVLQLAQQSSQFSQVSLIDFTQLALPIWDASLKNEYPLWQEQWQKTAKPLLAADAVIIISPEWEEESLANFYAFSRCANIVTLPCIVLRISSECRGAYSATDLALNNFTENSTYLILEHLIVATCDAVTSCKEPLYPLETPIIERILTTFKLMNQLVNHGGLSSAMRQQAI